LVIQPGLIAAVISGAVWLTQWKGPGSTSSISPNELGTLFLVFWAGMAGAILLFSLPQLVPDGVRWLRARKERAGAQKERTAAEKGQADAEKVLARSAAMVDEALRKAPLMLPAIRAMPHLAHICRELPEINVRSWERGVTFAMISIGKAGLLDKTDRERWKDLSADIGALLDVRLGDARDEFPSSEMDDFEADIKEELEEIQNDHPTLPFSDQFNFVVGQRVCVWGGIAQAFPASAKDQEILFYMTLGKSCAMAMARYS